MSLVLWVSPRAPVIWSRLTAEGNAAPLAVSLNTTVRDWFYHRDTGFRYNASFPLATTATCTGDTEASVTRATDFAGAQVPAANANGGSASVTGAIHHTIRAPAAAGATAAAARPCVTTGKTSASLSFSLAAGDASAVVATTVVRVNRDPSCVARPLTGSNPLCGLTTDAATTAAAIAHDLKSVTIDQAAADHAAHWTSFWNASGISLPDAPSTEDFW